MDDLKNKLIPNSKVLRNVLIILWVSLGVYLLIKLFGGNWFEIACQNERFIKVCEYFDTHYIPRYLISLTTSFILYAFLYLAILRQWAFTKVQFIMFTVYIVVQTLLKNIFMNYAIISFLLSVMTGFVAPTIIYLLTTKNKITWKFLLLNVLISNLFDFGFQLISVFIKNLGVKIIDTSTLITLIYGIDVFIMEALYYLYVNKLHQERSN